MRRGSTRGAQTLTTSSTASERAAAAFALGQLGLAWEPPSDETRGRAEAALIAAFATEKDPTVRDRIVEALGKVGGRAALAPLTGALDGKERARAAVALAALAKNRALSDESARAKLEALLADRAAETRWAAALALSRMHAPASRAALHGCTKDAAATVRAICAKALAEVGGDEDAPVLAPLLDDADGRVAAEAARTLVKLAGKCNDIGCPLLRALQSAKLPWRPSVVQAVTFEHWRGMAAASILRAAYEAVPKADKLDERTRALLACKLAMAHDRAVGRLELVTTCGATRVDERERALWTAQALADKGGPELVKLAASPHAAVREAAAEGADAATTKKLLGDEDAAVVDAAAERAEALKLADAAPLLQAALTRLHGPDAVEAQQAILSAAAALKLTALIPQARALVDAEPYALRQAAAHALTALEGKPTVARLPSLPSVSAGEAGADDDPAAHDARDHSRAAVGRRRAADRSQPDRARAQALLRQADVPPRGPRLRVARRRPARRRRRRPRLHDPVRDRHASLRRRGPRHGAVGSRHRRQPVLLHARARAAPRRALHRLRRGHQRSRRGHGARRGRRDPRAQRRVTRLVLALALAAAAGCAPTVRAGDFYAAPLHRPAAPRAHLEARWRVSRRPLAARRPARPSSSSPRSV